MRHPLKVVTIFVLCTVTTSAEDNWLQWRGPTGSGKTSAAATATLWGPDTNMRWRTELPEPGNSTPIVYGDRIFLTQPLGGSRERGLLCFNHETGQELWRRGRKYTADERTHRTTPYCSASPAADNERVFAW